MVGREKGVSPPLHVTVYILAQIETPVTFLWYGVVWLRVEVTAIHHLPLRVGTAVNPGPLLCNTL